MIVHLYKQRCILNANYPGAMGRATLVRGADLGWIDIRRSQIMSAARCMKPLEMDGLPVITSGKAPEVF